MSVAVPPQPTLALRLFGPFDARCGDQPLPRTRTRKEPWLLALLALRPGRRVDRVWLAETLWPDSDPEQALRNLRRSLSDLRAALGPADSWRLSSPTPGTVAFDGAGAEVDVAEFDAAIRRGTTDALARAVALYHGPLLEGCDEDWAMPERQAREDDCLRALETLAARRLEDGDPGGAIPLLRRAITLDPLRESALCALMSALAGQGDGAAAAKAYHDCRLRLRREMNAEVGESTMALFRQIQAQSRQHTPKPPPSAPPSPPPAPHLPQFLTSLVGRDGDVRAVRARLAQSQMVTLIGTGGIGKTRLAVEAARRDAPARPDGAWFVDLAPLSAPGLVARTVARTLSVREQPPQPLHETLAAALQPQRLLLVLDNCEHVLGECAALATALLDSCPGLTLLATSREALGVPGEVVCRVDPLPVPSPATGQSADAVLRCDAARLFAERSRAPGGHLLSGAGSADALAQVCRRLDGIPLALELAAARTGVMTVEQIARRLDDRFRLLSGGSPTALPRQQTLRALIDWSYDLLSAGEKALFRRLAVFAGGWTLEAAESVCAGDGIEESDVLDVLARLQDKSLLTAEPQGDAMRHGLLETLRQYAAEKLAESGEGDCWQQRHRDYFLGLAEQAEPQLVGPEQAAWLARLSAEHDNLRAALAWSLACVDGTGESLRLCAALGRFWQIRAHLSEGRDWCRRALALREGVGDIVPRARAARTGGDLAFLQGDLLDAERLYAESLPLFEAAGDVTLSAQLLTRRGNIAMERGDLDAARSLYERGLAMMRQGGDVSGAAAALNALGNVAFVQGDLPDAQRLYEEALALNRAQDNKQSVAAGLGNLANVACDLRDFAAARALHAESLTLKREVGDQTGVARTLFNLGNVEVNAGDLDTAQSLFADSLRVFRDLGDRRGCVYVLEMLAWVRVAGPDSPAPRLERAARLWGCADAAREALHCPLPPHDVSTHGDRVAAVRVALGEPAWARAWAAGRALSLEEACEEALSSEG